MKATRVASSLRMSDQARSAGHEWENIMTRKIASLAAASAIVLASIASTAAWAVPTQEPMPQGPDAGTLADMQSQCDAIAASYDTADGAVWPGEVVLGGPTLVSGPTAGGPRAAE